MNADVTGPAAGMTATLTFTVGPDDTATALGSGDVPVLATPRLVAWFEATSVAAVADGLESASTTVGTRVEIDHLAASGVGARVEVTAEIAAVEGRAIRFDVTAQQGDTVVGQGIVRRVVIDRGRFLGRVTVP